MQDSTENIRREMVQMLNANPGNREDLEATFDQVWDTQELQRDFSVEVLSAPFVVAVRKSDGARGILMFQNSPRFYFGWVQA